MHREMPSVASHYRFCHSCEEHCCESTRHHLKAQHTRNFKYQFLILPVTPVTHTHTHTHTQLSDHRLNGSSSPVLTATPRYHGKGQISTPYKISCSSSILLSFLRRSSYHILLLLCLDYSLVLVILSGYYIPQLYHRHI